MIITHGKNIINFDNVREVYRIEDDGQYDIKFFFDSTDTTVVKFQSKEDCLDAWHKVINAYDQKHTRCML